jgi:phosphatidate cytidylyltransferase
MLKKRIITALLLVALLVTLIMSLSPLMFAIMTVPVLLLAGSEWITLMEIKARNLHFAYLISLLLSLVGMGIWLNVGTSFRQNAAQDILLLAPMIWVVLFIGILMYPSGSKFWSARPVMGILGIVLLSLTWIAIISIQARPLGDSLLLIAFAIVAFSDVGGFVAGKLFGRHKLAPVISPGKTWEGLVGSLLFQVLLVSGLTSFVKTELSILGLSSIVVLVALVSVGGDLFESMVKRHIGVKDSGSALPGHGGILDRIDGMIPALPVYAVFLPVAQTL